VKFIKSISKMKLKKCKKCSTYTLNQSCPKCDSEVKNAHYKFLKIRDAPKSNPAYFKKK